MMLKSVNYIFSLQYFIFLCKKTQTIFLVFLKLYTLKVKCDNKKFTFWFLFFKLYAS